MEQTSTRVCPLCEAACGLEIRHDGQRVISVRGNPRDVFSAGYICPKGVALKELHEDPDRLRSPMRRVGGRFVAISWAEAYAEIAERLPALIAQHGADSIGLLAGNPTVHKAGALLYFPLLAHTLGSRNIFTASTLDQIPRQLASGLLYGSWFSVPVPDIARSKLLVILGANPVATAVMHAPGRPIDAFVVRKSVKTYGMQRLIEGSDVSGQRVLVVEDTSTTGNSALTAVHAVREAGGEVVGVATVVDRATGAAEAIEAEGLPYRSVLGLAELGLG